MGTGESGDRLEMDVLGILIPVRSDCLSSHGTDCIVAAKSLTGDCGDRRSSGLAENARAALGCRTAWDAYDQSHNLFYLKNIVGNIFFTIECLSLCQIVRGTALLD